MYIMYTGRGFPMVATTYMTWRATKCCTVAAPSIFKATILVCVYLHKTVFLAVKQEQSNNIMVDLF